MAPVSVWTPAVDASVATIDGGLSILDTAVKAFGQADVLVNNAGILRDKTLSNMDEAMWDIVVEVHLKGTFCVTQPVFRHMKERGQGGVIISTSSTSGLNGNFGQSNYGAAKSGIATFGQIAAKELARYGVKSNTVAPGARTRLTIATPGLEDVMAAREGQFDQWDPANISPLGAGWTIAS